MGFKKKRPSKGEKLPIIDKGLRLFLGKLNMNEREDATLGTALIFKKTMILRNSEGWKWEWTGKGIKLNDSILKG